MYGSFRNHRGLFVKPGCFRHTELALGCVSEATQHSVYVRVMKITEFTTGRAGQKESYIQLQAAQHVGLGQSKQEMERPEMFCIGEDGIVWVHKLSQEVEDCKYLRCAN